MRTARKRFWISLAVISVAAGAVAGLATRVRTYTVQQLTAHWLAPYDLVVLPKGVRAPVSGLVDPNSLDVGSGGISLAQYRRIARLPGVAVAAPLAPLGYLGIQIAYLELPPAPLLPDGFYRIAWQNRNQVYFVKPFWLWRRFGESRIVTDHGKDMSTPFGKDVSSCLTRLYRKRCPSGSRSSSGRASRCSCELT